MNTKTCLSYTKLKDIIINFCFDRCIGLFVCQMPDMSYFLILDLCFIPLSFFSQPDIWKLSLDFTFNFLIPDLYNIKSCFEDVSALQARSQQVYSNQEHPHFKSTVCFQLGTVTRYAAVLTSKRHSLYHIFKFTRNKNDFIVYKWNSMFCQSTLKDTIDNTEGDINMRFYLI